MATMALRSLTRSHLKRVMQTHNLSVPGRHESRNALVSRCLNSDVSVLGVMQWILPTPAGVTSSRTWEEDLARMALGSYRSSDLRKLTPHFDLSWGTGRKEDLIDRLVADRSTMSVLDCALRYYRRSCGSIINIIIIISDIIADLNSGRSPRPFEPNLPPRSSKRSHLRAWAGSTA